MPLTPNLSTVTLGGQYVDVSGAPIAGQVKFTPRTILTDADEDQIIIPRTITVDLDANGEFTVVLPATDDPDVAPAGFTYRVEEAFSGGRTYDIGLTALPATQNLADKVPTVPSGGTEATTYVLLGVFDALEARVDTIESVTASVQTAASQVSAAATAASAAQTAAQSAEARILHPFVFLGI